MGIEPSYIVAWLIPALVGGGIWIALRGVRAAGDMPAAIGAGWLIGIFVVAGLGSFAATEDTTHTLTKTLPWFVATGAIAWVVAWARRRGLWIFSARTTAIASEPRDGGVVRVLWWLLLIAIVVRLLLLGYEASLRPVFPWDAWSAWAVKPKTWFLVGRVEPYVSMQDWLSDPHAALRTGVAWSYPELLAWIELWFASAAGTWNEPLVDLAWCGALSAFALAAYGYWRGVGLRPWVAIVLVYALVSLPLIDAHVALAGYADLWVAVAMGLAALAWARWLIDRDRGQWIVAVAIALCLPAIKLEGAVWLLAFSAAVVLDLVPRRWRWRVAAVIAACALIGVLLGGFVLPMLGLGLVHVSWGSVEVPVLGAFSLQWHSVGGAMIAGLFTLPNWHLLWYLFPILALLRWRRFRDDRVARLLGLLVLIDLSFLFVLFFFTSASAWAQDFTSANRLILQIVPTVFVLIAVLLRGSGAAASATRAPRNTASGSDLQSAAS